MDSLGVVPVDPFGGGGLDGCPALPGLPVAAVVDQFYLVQADRGFHEGVVQGIADAADGASDACFFQSLGERYGCVLRTGVGVVYQAGGGELRVLTAAGRQCLLDRAGYQRGLLGAHDTPAENAPGVHVGDERDVHESGQRPHVGEVRTPPHVGLGRLAPVALEQVRMAWSALSAGGGDRAAVAPAYALNTGDPHEPADLVPADPVAGAAHRMPHLPDPVQLVVPPPQVDDGIHRIRLVQLGRGNRHSLVGAVRVRCDRNAVLGEHGTDRLNTELLAVVVDVGDDYRIRRSSSAAAKNADAVLRISFARRSSVFSFFSRAFSSASANPDDSTGRAAFAAASIQFLKVSGLMSSSSPTLRRAGSLGSPSASRSAYMRTARSRVSASNFRGAGTGPVSLLLGPCTGPRTVQSVAVIDRGAELFAWCSSRDAAWPSTLPAVGGGQRIRRLRMALAALAAVVLT